MSAAAFAGSTDTQTVYYEIDAINELVMDSDITLTVDAATAGSQPTFDFNNTVTYSITTNETAGKKITAAINSNMPSNTSLVANVNAVNGNSVSAGDVTLNTTAQSTVTSIETVAGGNAYELKFYANVAAGLPADFSKVITWTLADE
ncbi:MAG: hypothetical protein ABIH00_01240 [Armatimonadota bacterium]